MPVGAGSIKRAARSAETNLAGTGQAETEDKTRNKTGMTAAGEDVQAAEGKKGKKQKNQGEQKPQMSQVQAKEQTAKKQAAKKTDTKTDIKTDTKTNTKTDKKTAPAASSRSGSQKKNEPADKEKMYGIGEQLPVHLL